MDIKILLITIVFLSLACIALLFKLFIRPANELPRNACGGYGKGTKDGEEKCIVCGFKNTDWCPTDDLSDENKPN